MHSCILNAVARVATSGDYKKFCTFLRWWDPDQNFKKEHMPTKKGDKVWISNDEALQNISKNVCTAIRITLQYEDDKEAIAVANKFLSDYGSI